MVDDNMAHVGVRACMPSIDARTHAYRCECLRVFIYEYVVFSSISSHPHKLIIQLTAHCSVSHFSLSLLLYVSFPSTRQRSSICVR